DPRLVEKTRFGLLPRIGPDGARPAEVYARPQFVPPKLKSAPRVALVVGGLGLSEEGTANAIAQLPGAVSLGFAPYGSRVSEDAAAAREAGHETLLQLPMEPFDYASDNPGPHTLLTSSSDAQRLDDLHWLLGRFQGYAGVTNFLGAKFTADESALSPVLRELANRGLFYIDDGASPRSLARDDAAKIKLPAVAADVVIDAVQKPEAIEDALNRLETLARSNGAAVGVASALPVSIERISRWARGLEARGLALTPVSAIVARGPGSAAQASP
ncbi:MAG TPA: divergent polysaccharide deacetylase family protein, partial [Roseiarcus sp.]|nr:divergent polysaccharide deacetylase family protein [Roseiarcus sp.]